MIYGSVCSGIEAASEAWSTLGWRPAWFSEIDKFPCEILKAHHPDVPNLGDMSARDFAARAKAIAEIDVFVGGTPCQAFSVAGNRESLADERGNLSLTYTELCHELDPRWAVWENVPGVLNTKDNAFGCFLAGLVGDTRPVESWLDGGRFPVAGMVIGPCRSAAWRVLDAQYFGVAQRRRRVFVVSGRTSDRTNPAAVLFEPESVCGNPPKMMECNTVLIDGHAGANPIG